MFIQDVGPGKLHNDGSIRIEQTQSTTNIVDYIQTMHTNIGLYRDVLYHIIVIKK